MVDFKSPPTSDGCPIREMDTLHLILFMLYRRVTICSSFDLDCIDLPIMATTPFLARNCEREDVYRLLRRLRRLSTKLGGDIEIFKHGGITASLRLSFERGSIYVHNGVIVNKGDCSKVKCELVNNVNLAFMYLAIKLSERNEALLNVPDALVWLAKIVGVEGAVGLLSFVHDYVEMGEFNGNVRLLVGLISRWGVPITVESLSNALLPARRSLNALRQASY